MKYDRYRRVHERLSLALQHGFYIEAAMICESLIADRLHSHLHWRVHEANMYPASFFGKYAVGVTYAPDATPTGKVPFVPFGILIRMYAKSVHDDHRPDHPAPPRWVNSRRTISPAILQHWAEERNAVAHGAVKTHPTRKSYAENFKDFQERAERCARNGALLAQIIGTRVSKLRGKSVSGGL